MSKLYNATRLDNS